MTKHFLRAAVGAAAVVGLGVGATGALADGYYVGSVKDTAPVPAPVAYEWNGFSVGAGIGVGRFDQDGYAKAWRKDAVDVSKYKKCHYRCWWKYKYIGDYDFEKHRGLDDYAESDDWSFFGTVQVGYDRLLGDRFLIGAFADFDFINDSDLTFSNKSPSKSLTGEIERENMWTVGGRFGFLATPRILVYGLAGFSRMSLDGDVTAYIKDPLHKGNHTNLGLSVDEDVDGWTVGGGVEAKLEKRLSLKLEYRYSQFDGLSAKASDIDHDRWAKKHGHKLYVYDRTIHEGAKVDLGDTDVHSIRAVLSFKLGRDEEPIAPLK